MTATSARSISWIPNRTLAAQRSTCRATHPIASESAPATPTATPVWSRTDGGKWNEGAKGLSVDDAGSWYVTGHFSGSAAFGGGSLTSAGSTDGFVAKYTGSGSHLWSSRFGGPGSDYGVDVAWDGQLYVTGNFEGSVDFGGGPMTSAGSSDFFIAKYAPTNFGHVWSHRYGGASFDEVRALAVSGTHLFASGRFVGTVDFGVTSLTSAGSFDVFLLRAAP
jgi:hypothetical protein